MRAAVLGVVVAWALTACGPDPETPASAPTPAPSRTQAADDTPYAGLSQRQLDQRLIAAAWRNDVKRARQLIKAGANVNAKDKSEQSAYLISTSEGYLDLLELTLRHGADVDSLDRFDGTGLIRAAERGHHHIVGRLLQTGIDVDHVNNLGWVALHEAIVLGDGGTQYVRTVRALVAGGANLVVAPKRDGISPIDHARRRGFDRIALVIDRALEARRMTKNEADKALLRAARNDDADAAAIALRHGADIETHNGAGRTPLLLASMLGHTEVAQLLVDLGADPDALDERHDTAWLVTGVSGSVPMAKVIAAAGPDYGIVNRFGGTSLIPASERGHADYVAWAVENTPMKVDHVNHLGWTALLEAVILGEGTQRWQRIVRTLLDAGADPGIADEDGVTPLQHARNRGHDEIVRMFEGA